MTLDDVRDKAVVDVPRGGALLGLSRSAAYRAAARGELPTIRIGRKLLVPVPQLLDLLEGRQVERDDDRRRTAAATAGGW